jgi:hypothetical protein
MRHNISTHHKSLSTLVIHTAWLDIKLRGYVLRKILILFFIKTSSLRGLAGTQVKRSAKFWRHSRPDSSRLSTGPHRVSNICFLNKTLYRLQPHYQYIVYITSNHGSCISKDLERSSLWSTDENDENCRSEYPVSRPRFEWRTLRI